MVVAGNSVTINGQSFDVALEKLENGVFILILGDRRIELFAQTREDGNFDISINNVNQVVTVKDESDLLLESYASKSASGSGLIEVKAPMPGLVYKSLVSEGDQVEKGQGVLILEAMKMENEIRSGHRASVEKVFVEEGQAVAKGEKLLLLHLGD